MSQIAEVNRPVDQRLPQVDRLLVQLRRSRWNNLAGDSMPWANALCTMILALNTRLKLHQIVDALPYRTDSVTKIEALNALANLGFPPSSTRLSLHSVDARLCPCIFVLQARPDAPLVVMARTDQEFTVFDSETGEIEKIGFGDRRLHEHGTAWFARTYDESASKLSQFMRAGSGHSWFRALLGRFSGLFLQIVATGFVINLTALAMPIFIMLVYDRVIGTGSAASLDHLVFGVLLAVCAEILLRDIRSRGLAWLAGRLDHIVGTQIFERLVGLPPSSIERATVPAQIARIKTFESVRDFFSGPLFLSLLELPFVAIALVVMAILAGPLVLVPITAIVALAGLFLLIRRHIRVAIRQAAKASTARQRFAIETFEKLAAIKSGGLVDQWRQKYRSLSGREGIALFRLKWLGVVAEVGAHALTVLAGVATVSIGVSLVWSGSISAGGLVASMILIWRIMAPFHSLCTAVPRLEQLRSSVEQVNALMEVSTEDRGSPSTRMANVKGEVAFHDVGMRYDGGDDPALRGVSFTAKPGDLVVVTGNNGSGKSTLLKLIKGLYRATDGSVAIDGFDVRQLDPVYLRRQIAYMPQAPQFFAGTVLENLLFANPIASAEDIDRALAICDVADEVRAMPEGLNTHICGDAKYKVSSSVAARLSLARAMLSDAQIILIDELPNALVSSETGTKLKALLKDNHFRKTVFVVSYREDIIDLADIVLELQRGTPAVVRSANALQVEQAA